MSNSNHSLKNLVTAINIKQFSNMKNILIFAVLIIFGSCETKEGLSEPTGKRKSIIGKWQLINYCFSPGDASCPEQKVEANQGQIIEFEADGKYTVTKKGDKTTLLECAGEWKDVDITKIEVIPSCEPTLTKRTLFISINDDKTLTMSPQCIEACKFTFRALN
jgi:hypothetical protein